MARATLQMLGIQHPSDSTAGFGFSMAGMDIIDPVWVHPLRRPKDIRKDRIFAACVVAFCTLYVLALVAGMSCFSCAP
jgi:hypothetical protein